MILRNYLDNIKIQGNLVNTNTRSVLYNIIGAVLSLFTSFSLVTASLAPLGITFDTLSIFLIIAMFSFCWLIIFYSKYTIKVTSIGAVVLVIIAAIASLPGGNLAKFYSSAVNFFKWCSDYVNGYENLSRQNELLFTLLLCMLVTMALFLLTVKISGFIVLLAAGSGLFGFLWINNRPLNFTAFYIFVACIIIYYLKSIYASNNKRKTNDFASPVFFTLWILPFCGLIFLLSYIIPVSPSPIQWKWLDKKINDFYEAYDYTSYRYFSLSSIGLGDSNTRLGGAVTTDDMLVLGVETPRLVYLKGSVRDSYNGSTWSNTDKKALSFSDRKNSLYIDMLELKSGMQLLTGESNYMDKYFYKDNIKITFASLKTKTLFYPLKTEKINALNNSIKPYINSDSSMFDKKNHSKDFKYSIDSYSIKVNNEDLKNLLRKSSIGFYKNTKTIPAGLNPNDIDTLYKNTQNIYTKYLQLPDKLPADIKKLSETVTAGLTNNYDKVAAIEQYLSANYSYTLSPTQTNPEVDFTYDFLFNTKEGYCTHYATAMTVLVRSLGIPARYVEGYILPEKPKTLNFYEVTNQQAHAWVEVYFEGFGWMPFEPTSPFTESFYLNSDPAPDALQTPRQNKPMPADNQVSKAYKPPEKEKSVQEYNVNPPEKLTKPDEKDLGLLKLLLTILAFLSPFGILGIVIYINAKRSRKRIQTAMQLSPRESVLVLYKYYLRMLSLLGVPIKVYETPYQYYERINMDSALTALNLGDISGIFVRARYDKNPLENTDKRRFHQFYEPLMQTLQTKLGLPKFYIYKYLLGII